MAKGLKNTVKEITKDVPMVHLGVNAAETKKKIIEGAHRFDTLTYVYVTDAEGKLVGVFSPKELFRQEDNRRVEEFMINHPVSARLGTDQEEVAILALHHHLKAIPIVDASGKLLGVISSDAILNILHAEHIEDLLKSAGIHTPVGRTLDAPATFLVKARLPWLLIGLLGGVLAAKLTGFFEDILKQYFVVATFIPLMVYIADAVGTQTEVLFIRNLALRGNLSIRKYLWREIKIGLAIAFCLGSVLLGIGLWWSGSLLMGAILGTSLFLTSLAGIFLPIIVVSALRFFKKDPATGAGPFATIIQDMASLLIYFMIATTFISLFGM